MKNNIHNQIVKLPLIFSDGNLCSTIFLAVFSRRYRVYETILFRSKYFRTWPFLRTKAFRNNSILVHWGRFPILTSLTGLSSFPFYPWLKNLFWRTFNLGCIIIGQAFMLVREWNYKALLPVGLFSLSIVVAFYHTA